MNTISQYWSKFLRNIYYWIVLDSYHKKLIEHPVRRSYLTATNITNNGNPISATANVDLGRLKMDLVDFCFLFSVFNESDFFEVQVKNPTADFAPAGTYIAVRNNSLIEVGHVNRTGIYSSGQKQSLHLDSLHIDHFVLKDAGRPKQMATVAFALSAITAFRSGFSGITLLAAGGPSYDPFWNGYKVWPKLGFDAPLNHEEMKVQSFMKCRTVQDLREIDAGWWDGNGDGRLMTFDLAPSSRSWKILLGYLRSRL